MALSKSGYLKTGAVVKASFELLKRIFTISGPNKQVAATQQVK